MEQDRFDIRFLELQASANERGWIYGFRHQTDIWKNVSSNPFDALFTKLAELYLESSETQRQRLYAYCGTQHEFLENAWYFIRRIGMLIQSQEDLKWLEIGIASALLDGGRADFRDLITSLNLLCYAAERCDIAIRPILETFIQSAEGRIKEILENVRDSSELSIHIAVQKFGHPNWVAASLQSFGYYKEHMQKEQSVRPSQTVHRKISILEKIVDFLSSK